MGLIMAIIKIKSIHLIHHGYRTKQQHVS